MVSIRTALISVYNKEGIAEFAKALAGLGIEIISTGGTAKMLREAGIKITNLSDFTGCPEMMDGRVKTLHPKIHGGILMDRGNPKHVKEAAENKIRPIDLVVANLYPFEKTVLGEPTLEEAIENIDIGGPTLIRAAAKNYRNVAVVCKPERYGQVLAEIRKDGKVSEDLRKQLVLEAWEQIAHYDNVIENYFRKKFGDVSAYPEYLNLTFRKKQDLRYGENPHQTAALYIDEHEKNPSLLRAKQLQGKQLSFNNVLDANSAYNLIKEFGEATAVIVKHNNPCGVASDNDIRKAYTIARSVDPEAAFGGIVAVNGEVDGKLAGEITSRFVEIVLAPSFTEDAKKIFLKKPNIRVLELPIKAGVEKHRRYRSVLGGFLVQDSDVELYKELKVVTKRKPTDEEMKSMLYAWKIAKYVRSNAIVYAKENRAVGIGAGQMKRVDAAKLGAMIAKDYAGEGSLRGCAMASDAFFPFRDGIDYAAKLGVTAIIQPGGSVSDRDVIAAADEHGMAMVFTGMRHFRH
ncbi:bifunctional phosphoribosylaminoimidazolecarboxamide formyltransferase/IMP cyclohydrolase [Candidatus Micrarchaeota archaeon]|nr:bifunctional phosphoribosylaminoimidazolecarboxamide formyltransferase/IMP cyclohydrolase [Candidatus Micrarchaeota archaeon]